MKVELPENALATVARMLAYNMDLVSALREIEDSLSTAGATLSLLNKLKLGKSCAERQAAQWHLLIEDVAGGELFATALARYFELSPDLEKVLCEAERQGELAALLLKLARTSVDRFHGVASKDSTIVQLTSDLLAMALEQQANQLILQKQNETVSIKFKQGGNTIVLPPEIQERMNMEITDNDQFWIRLIGRLKVMMGLAGLGPESGKKPELEVRQQYPNITTFVATDFPDFNSTKLVLDIFSTTKTAPSESGNS